MTALTEAARIPLFVLGFAIVVVITVGIFTTLVVPRATSSRLLRWLSRNLARLLQPVMRWFGTYESKDRIMAVVGPLALVLVFAVWLAALVVGFGLMIQVTGSVAFWHSFLVAGSSIFTLGFANGPDSGSRALEVLAAGLGLLIIALEIAYLPALYNAFAAREIDVTLLATRAGTPAWGPEVLVRAHRFGTMDQLPALYSTWERWAANVAESHTNYPTLMYFRSPVPTRSWLTALTAMLDAAALHDALAPGSAPRQARLLLQMGTNCLRGIALVLDLPFDPDPLPSDSLRLRREEFLAAASRLEQFDFPMERTVEEAWPNFAGWRVNYEKIVDELTALVVPPPAPWFSERPELGFATWPRIYDRTPEHPRPDVSEEI